MTTATTLLKRPKAINYILTAWLVAGTMDITAASIQYYNKTGKTPLIVLRYIASAVFGKGAMAGGTKMEIAGLLFHYLVALIWTILFFILCSPLRLYRMNKVIVGLLYGLFVWMVMNLAVVPIAFSKPYQFDFNKASISCLILMFCIGLPISWIIGRYYTITDYTDSTESNFRNP